MCPGWPITPVQKRLVTTPFLFLVVFQVVAGNGYDRALKETCEYAAYISQIEPKSFKETEHDESWINAMQKELGQFEKNKGWTLVPRPTNYKMGNL